MIPIPLLITVAKKYLPHALAAMLVFAMYLYWHHKVYSEGYDAAVIKYEKRDAETERQGRELMILKQHETDLINKQNAERAFNAAKIYNDHYSRIISDRSRMPISTTKTNRSCDTLPRDSKSSGGIGRTGATVHEPTIQEGTLRSIEDGQLACEKLLNMFAQ